MFSSLLLLCFLLLLSGCEGGGGRTNSPANPSANSITLAWDAPTTRVDGTPVTEDEIGGYAIHWNQDDYSTPIGTTTSKTITINSLQSGEYCFKATTLDLYGSEGPLTNDPVCKTFQLPS